MTSRTLRMLYRQIPKTSPCKAGCMDCCGPVAWAKEEFAKVEADLLPSSARIELMGVSSVVDAVSGRCAFATPQGCRVYDRRPLVCRLFGALKGAPLMECPHGVKAAKPLTVKQEHAIMLAYHREDMI
ncbi:MAG: YkgJ family cysteine cluster protein [Bacteroidia bacterium]|jgi:uncharacterized protein